MNCVTSTLVLALSMSVLNICNSQTTDNFTCDQLPKVDFLSIEVLIANSPLQHDFVLTEQFDCTTKTFTRPARGTTGYTGTVISVTRSKAIIRDYTLGSDNKTAEGTICTTSEKNVWYSSASKFDDNGAFLCVYACNGTLLKEFGCASNNNGTSPAELEAVKMARRVPNGHLIHNARKNCTLSKGCKFF